jgi:hypothetical protein
MERGQALLAELEEGFINIEIGSYSVALAATGRLS